MGTIHGQIVNVSYTANDVVIVEFKKHEYKDGDDEIWFNDGMFTLYSDDSIILCTSRYIVKFVE